MFESIRTTLNYSPLAVLGFLNALHTFMYGIGYLLIEKTDFSGTVLAEHVGQIMQPELFGFIMLVLGVVCIWAYIKQRSGIIATTSTAQAGLWLFVTLLYFLNGSFALGIAIGLTWCLISGYLGYAWRERGSIILYNSRILE